MRVYCQYLFDCSGVARGVFNDPPPPLPTHRNNTNQLLLHKFKIHHANPRTSADISLEIKDPVDPTHSPNPKPSSPNSAPTPPLTTMTPSPPPPAIPKHSYQSPNASATFPLKTTRLVPKEKQTLLNIHQRVKVFAEAQRKSVVDVSIEIPGGRAGHTVSPCRAAGCYAPGGRYPLPSSVLMTVVTARAAGCPYVVLASPRPAPITLAAAHVAGADIVLCVGGAQAIGCMAYGIEACDELGAAEVPACDVIVGPGNKWVTAAKSLVNGYCGIDMLAGPSEVLVIADHTADVEIVAADLIAQAEHDVVARAILVSTDVDVIAKVNAEVERQVDCLPEPNRSTAKEA
ncbi:histidinol dehydrogenase [Skeletonema marinoi]|uniref:Histidinol dehydrogenase n=1 Tax=Skeletonema marinoi TaxID=267567 RepID=A0AAD8Y3I6_9STRA|nr:histidinol dehydrogenase [Skeletonema marinoi]